MPTNHIIIPPPSEGKLHLMAELVNQEKGLEVCLINKVSNPQNLLEDVTLEYARRPQLPVSTDAWYKGGQANRRERRRLERLAKKHK